MNKFMFFQKNKHEVYARLIKNLLIYLTKNKSAIKYGRKALINNVKGLFVRVTFQISESNAK